MASIGQSITGPRFVETDEVLPRLTLMLSWLRLSQWFDRQKAHLEILESQLRGLVKAIEVVSRHRSGLSFNNLTHEGYLTQWTELASATGEFAQTVSDLAASDLGKSVSHSLEALAELERKAQETESAQARADQATLLSTADEYARLVSSVRVSVMTGFDVLSPWYADLSASSSSQMAFSSRVRVYHAYQNAEAELRRVKQAHERNRAQGKTAPEKTDRLRHSYSQIGDVRRSFSFLPYPSMF